MEHNEAKTKCALIIPSCDHYSDVWEPFFVQFFKYWPDCPFPVYLISNFRKYPDPRVNALLTGKDPGWGGSMRLALEIITTPYFIYMLEDIPLKEKTDTARILKLLSIVIDEQAAYLRLYPEPGPDLPYKNYAGIGLIKKDFQPFREFIIRIVFP